MNELVVSKESAIQKMDAIKSFQNVVKSQLIEGEDYGTVVGIPKPFLFKSGAEKILSILGVSYEKPEYTETWKEVAIGDYVVPFYEVVCKVVAKIGDSIVGFGIGSCNTLEKKYCYVKGQFMTDPIHYYSLKNTILKMAEKKAKVDLALHIGALSNIFTQDEDNVIENEQENAENTKNTEKKEAPPANQATTPKKASAKQIDYLLSLLESKKNDNPALVREAAKTAQVVVEDNKVIVKGSFEQVSKAIDMLKQ